MVVEKQAVGFNEENFFLWSDKTRVIYLVGPGIPNCCRRANGHLSHSNDFFFPHWVIHRSRPRSLAKWSSENGTDQRVYGSEHPIEPSSRCVETVRRARRCWHKEAETRDTGPTTFFKAAIQQVDWWESSALPGPSQDVSRCKKQLTLVRRGDMLSE